MRSKFENGGWWRPKPEREPADPFPVEHAAVNAALAAVNAASPEEMDGARARLDAALADLERKTNDIAATVARRSMSNTKYEQVTAALAVVTQRAQALAQHDAEAAEGKFPEKYATRQRATLAHAVATADDDAVKAMDAYRADTLGEAARLRAKSEASRDATERLADEMEIARLGRSPLDGDEFARQAAQMLEAGQPRRAQMLLAVAREKGSRITSEFDATLDAALDEADPDRKAAREVEQEVLAKTAEFTTKRTAFLASTVGMGSNGQAGHGSRDERTRASIAGKVAAVAAGATAFPVGDGSGSAG